MLSPIVVALAGLAAVPHAVFALAWTLAAGLAILRWPGGEPPFARRFERSASTAALGGYMGSFVVVAALGVSQSLVAELPLALPIGALVGGIVALALWRLGARAN